MRATSLILSVTAQINTQKREAFKDARLLAEKLGLCVHLEFNSITVPVYPNSTFEEYERLYDHLSEIEDEA